jgi:hypothetical protein
MWWNKAAYVVGVGMEREGKTPQIQPSFHHPPTAHQIMIPSMINPLLIQSIIKISTSEHCYTEDQASTHEALRHFSGPNYNKEAKKVRGSS